MKAKFVVGGEFETTTPEEFAKELRSWQAEMVRGVKFRSPHVKGLQTGTTWSVASDGSSAEKGSLGPERDFVWSVLSIAVSGTAIAAADTFNVWSVTQSATSAIILAAPRYVIIPPGSLVLGSEEYLTLSGGANAGAGDVWVSLRVAEVPATLAWRILG